MRSVLTSSDVVGGKENDGPSPEARYFAVEERVLPFDVARRDVARARTLRHESFGPVPIPNGEIMGKLTRLLPCSLFSACFLASLGAQVPATYQTFGQGCAGSPAVPYLYALKLPVVGREAAIAVQNLTANSLAVLVFGGSNSTWNNQPLPLNLGFLGAGNCNLLVSFDAPLLLSTGSGMAVLVVRIPKDPSAIGATFYNQLFTPDPASNSAGLAASNGAKATIGDCLCLPERSVTEAFADATMLDTEHSGGTWAGGRVVLPKVGGSGRHGVFDHTLGTLQGASTYLWSTDSMRIPGTHTE
ncbi:MAG: hypothetical protein KDC87_11380, partial [Planctomycetes bacterium]|nr:hypothetical protein [Planctomycetota bacterium]